MPVGKRKYKDPAKMQIEIDKYFKKCKRNGDIPSVTGLALALRFCQRKSLIDYSKYPGFEDVIAEAKTRCFHLANQMALKGEIKANMFMFNAINNYGMISSRSESSNRNDNTHSGELTVKTMLDDLDSGGLPKKDE